MKSFVVTHRTLLALAASAAIGVGGMSVAHDAKKGQVKVIQLSQRDILEKLDGKLDLDLWAERRSFGSALAG